MSRGSLAALISGFVILLLVVTGAAVYITRWYSVGRFGTTSGAVKFNEEVSTHIGYNYRGYTYQLQLPWFPILVTTVVFIYMLSQLPC